MGALTLASDVFHPPPFASAACVAVKELIILLDTNEETDTAPTIFLVHPVPPDDVFLLALVHASPVPIQRDIAQVTGHV